MIITGSRHMSGEGTSIHLSFLEIRMGVTREMRYPDRPGEEVRP